MSSVDPYDHPIIFTSLRSPTRSGEVNAELNRQITRLEELLSETEARVQALEANTGHEARLRRLEDQIDRCATRGCPSCHRFILDYKAIRV